MRVLNFTCCILVAKWLQSHVDYSKLNPEDQLRLLALFAASETRPNNTWWQGFLSTLQRSLKAYKPAQLVLLLTSLSEIGGRPPQTWLAAHESALVTSNNHSNSVQALSFEGWLLLLQCYAQNLYQPTEEFQSAFERSMAGVLGSGTKLSPESLAGLLGSVARLQMACSPQLKNGIINSLNQVRLLSYRVVIVTPCSKCMPLPWQASRVQ